MNAANGKTPGKVWLVTAGDYSDYHVVGVFSTEEKAKAYAALTLDSDVEESELDPGDGCEIKKPHWKVWRSLPSSLGLEPNDPGKISLEITGPHSDGLLVPPGSRAAYHNGSVVSFVDRQHARKVWQEQEQAQLRAAALGQKWKPSIPYAQP